MVIKLIGGVIVESTHTDILKRENRTNNIDSEDSPQLLLQYL